MSEDQFGGDGEAESVVPAVVEPIGEALRAVVSSDINVEFVVVPQPGMCEVRRANERGDRVVEIDVGGRCRSCRAAALVNNFILDWPSVRCVRRTRRA